MRNWLPVLGLFGVASSLGLGHIGARLAFANGTNVLTGSLTRALSATVLLFVLLHARRTPIVPVHREFKATLVIGLFIAAQTSLVQLAVALLPVSIAVLVFYLFPIFIGLASTFLGDEKLSGRLFGTLTAAFAGLVLVLGVGPRSVDPYGVAAAVAAALCFAAALVLTPRLAPSIAAPLRTFYTLATAAIVFIVIAGVSRGIDLPDNPTGWYGLWLLSLAYALGITGLFLLLPLLGPTQTAVVLNLEPVVVAVIAWLALGESLAPLQVLGAAIVLGAVLLFQVTAPRR